VEGVEMAKTNKFMLEYSTVFGYTVDYNNIKPPKKTMKRFIRLIESVTDKRLEGMIQYPLSEIIVIAFLAVLGNASNWIDIEAFGISYEKWLKKFLALKNGIPSHDTFRRVFGLIKSEELEAVTVAFIADIIGKLKKTFNLGAEGLRHISVDGKEERATGRKYNTPEEIKNIQTLHIYDNSYGICLYSNIINEKTNEIPVAQSILKHMELKGSIVSFDALHTQKKTVEIIREQKGQYVGSLKGNQGTLEMEVSEFFTEEELNSIKGKGKDYYSTKEKAHNQIETREFFLTEKIKWFEELHKWAGLKSFVCYKKKMINLVTNEETLEFRYYIASITDVKLCAETIRGHWGVENLLHWHLDTAFGEDDNTTVDKHAFNNLSIINKMTLSLLKLSKPLFKHNSIKAMRKQYGWKMEKNLAKILNFFSDDKILGAIEIARPS
jgi:predicted transposase YbfD/YdcC